MYWQRLKNADSDSQSTDPTSRQRGRPTKTHRIKWHVEVCSLAVNSNKHLVMRTRRGSTSRHADWLTISRNVTLTMTHAHSVKCLAAVRTTPNLTRLHVPPCSTSYIQHMHTCLVIVPATSNACALFQMPCHCTDIWWLYPPILYTSVTRKGSEWCYCDAGKRVSGCNACNMLLSIHVTKICCAFLVTHCLLSTVDFQVDVLFAFSLPW
jgi:hypothetical protein